MLSRRASRRRPASSDCDSLLASRRCTARSGSHRRRTAATSGSPACFASRGSPGLGRRAFSAVLQSTTSNGFTISHHHHHHHHQVSLIQQMTNATKPYKVTPALQSYIYPVTVFIPATSENILVSTIFSGRHRDTLVDIAIVFFLLRPL